MIHEITRQQADLKILAEKYGRDLNISGVDTKEEVQSLLDFMNEKSDAMDPSLGQDFARSRRGRVAVISYSELRCSTATIRFRMEPKDAATAHLQVQRKPSLAVQYLHQEFVIPAPEIVLILPRSSSSHGRTAIARVRYRSFIDYRTQAEKELETELILADAPHRRIDVSADLWTALHGPILGTSGTGGQPRPRAARYYGVDVSEVARHVGQAGGTYAHRRRT